MEKHDLDYLFNRLDVIIRKYVKMKERKDPEKDTKINKKKQLFIKHDKNTKEEE